METVLIKCGNCQTVNRVIVEKFNLKPKCHKCKTILDWQKKPISVHSGNFNKEVTEEPGIVLAEFWSPTCGYCYAMNPLLDKFATEKAGIIKLVKINSAADPYLASLFNILGVPSFVLFNGGKKIAEQAGAMSKEQLEMWVKTYIRF